MAKMINISEFFEKPDHQKWLELAAKSITKENELNFDNLEGINFHLDYQEVESVNLTTFPDSIELIKDVSWDDIFSLWENSSKKWDEFKQEFLQQNDELIINSSLVHDAGGSVVQEIAFILSLLSEFEKTNVRDIKILVAIDSLYFSNIAKLRSIRFMIESLSEKFVIPSVKIIGMTSKREQTLYDPWVNMLRSTMSTSAMFNGGVDQVLIDSYDKLAESFFDYTVKSIGKRQAENIFYVLNEESFLGMVKDPAKGSYTIENLTREYISKSFSQFLSLEEQGGLFKNLNKFSIEVEKNAKKREERILTQAVSIVGVNNYPNVDESLKDYFGEKKVLTQNSKYFPLRRAFEKIEYLRQELEDEKLKIVIIALGEQRELSARAGFAKNYLELLGHHGDVLYVANIDDIKIEKDIDVLCFCALDKDYHLFDQLKMDSSLRLKLIATKNVQLDGFENIYMGKNILETFSLLQKKERV